VARPTPLPVTISLTLMTSVAAHAEPIGTRTCARWLDGREQHPSTTMETWVEGYLAWSNQWALTLRLTDTLLLVPRLLNLIDRGCKSNPDARLANVVLDVIWSELSLGGAFGSAELAALGILTIRPLCRSSSLTSPLRQPRRQISLCTSPLRSLSAVACLLLI
jgi:hypothetical protein